MRRPGRFRVRKAGDAKSTLTASGGINGLTLANGITGTNFNITGVNEIEIADPGEGIRWKSGSSGDTLLAVVDDASDNRLNFSGTNASMSINDQRVFADDYHPNADKWTTARTLSLTGDVTGSVSWDGSANASITATVADDSHSHSNYLSTSSFKGYNTVLQFNSSSGGRVKIRLPFQTNSAKMLTFTISVMAGYHIERYDISGYLYPSTNQWYSPRLLYKGTSTPDVYVGRDADNIAYVSLLVGSYVGLTVHDVTVGYTGNESDIYNSGWSAAFDTDLSNSVSLSVQRVFHDGYHPNADKWTTARTNTVTLTGDVTGSGSASVDGTGNWTVSLTTTVADDSHSHSNYLPLAGGTLQNGDNVTLEMRPNDAGQAYLKVGRSLNGSQGTGIVEVTQDGSHGGGFYYNGDNTPQFISGETADTITFYRMNAGSKARVFQYGYSSDIVTFTATPTVNGTAVSLNGHTHNYAGSSSAGGAATSALKWTTARTNTVTLTGDVTGSGSASVDGSGNWTVTIATTGGGGSGGGVTTGKAIAMAIVFG